LAIQLRRLLWKVKFITLKLSKLKQNYPWRPPLRSDRTIPSSECKAHRSPPRICLIRLCLLSGGRQNRREILIAQTWRTEMNTTLIFKERTPSGLRGFSRLSSKLSAIPIRRAATQSGRIISQAICRLLSRSTNEVFLQRLRTWKDVSNKIGAMKEKTAFRAKTGRTISSRLHLWDLACWWQGLSSQ